MEHRNCANLVFTFYINKYSQLRSIPINSSDYNFVTLTNILHELTNNCQRLFFSQTFLHKIANRESTNKHCFVGGSNTYEIP